MIKVRRKRGLFRLEVKIPFAVEDVPLADSYFL